MKMAPKKSATKKKSTNDKGNIIDIIVIGLETIATIIKQSNIVLNNFVRNHDSYGQYLKNWPLIEREKLPIPPPLKFPHREGEKMVRQAIIGGRFL